MRYFCHFTENQPIRPNVNEKFYRLLQNKLRKSDSRVKIESEILIPFHIFSHENRFAEYEKDEAGLELLKAEYGQIRARLEALAEKGTISEYIKCTLVDMSNKVLENIARKYDSVRKGVKAVMGGKVLEYEAKTIREKGIEEGIEKGMEKGVEKGIEKGIRGTVSILKNLGVPLQTIQAQIQEQYGISPEALKKYL